MKVHLLELRQGPSYFFLLLLSLAVSIFTGPRYGQAQALNPNAFTQVTAGLGHSLALRADGTLWGWGSNEYGQLGDGTTQFRNGPILVNSPGNSSWIQVSAGLRHTVALQADGSLWAWGSNDFGQLGDGSANVNRAIPTRVVEPATAVAGSTWQQIVASTTYTLGLRSDGTLWAWGSSGYGATGLGETGKLFLTPTQIATPAAASSRTIWTRVAAGGTHALALRSDGSLWAWGDNQDGAVGDGTLRDRLAPVLIDQPTTAATAWTTVSAGLGHSLALRVDGTLWGWGDNRNGQLATAFIEFPRVLSPRQILAPEDGERWATPVAGEGSSQALRTDGSLWAWGRNDVGQLGVNSTATVVQPRREFLQGRWTQVAFGSLYSLAISAGQVYATGLNSSGQLGLGSGGNSLHFYVRLPSLPGQVTPPGVPLPVAAGTGAPILRCFPNPAQQWVHVEGIRPGTSLTLADMQGRPVRRYAPAGTDTILAVDGLAAGVYLLTAHLPSGPPQVIRLLLE